VLAYPSAVISLIVSDVVDDRLEVIASGPTTPDPTTYEDALVILRQGGLLRWVPRAVVKHLKLGSRGFLPETPKGPEAAFALTLNHIVCSNRLALEAAVARGTELGFETELIPDPLSGDARSAAGILGSLARLRWTRLRRGNRPLCLIAGGETSVAVRGRGTGGRNQEFALARAQEIAGIGGITCLSAGTDGTDGPTDAAGAVVDGDTVSRSFAVGLNPTGYLENNDSYGFFEYLAHASPDAAQHLKIGPTGTNVMDLVAITISPPGASHGTA
jgi:glycerate-2-kinase